MKKGHVLLDDFVQQFANDLHAALLLTRFDTQLLPVRNVERLVARVRLLLLAQLQVVLIGNDGKDVGIRRAVREELARLVRRQPLLQLPTLFGVGFGVRERHLMRVERAFDEFAVDLLRSAPSLDHGGIRLSQSLIPLSGTRKH